MIVENPDALKTWLTAVLEPLCDADPAALAKYVFALVKKDKPLQQLKDSMIEQLEVFLQNETRRFVSLLFVVLDKQDFTYPVPPSIAQLASGETPSSTTEIDIKTEALLAPDSASSIPTPVTAAVSSSTSSALPSDTNLAVNGSGSSVANNVNSTAPTTANTSNVSNSAQINGAVATTAPAHSYSGRTSHRKSDSDREDKSRVNRTRHRSPSPSRNRSRSRSWERSRRSRSRERLRDRDRSRWRNKSPPPRRYDRERRRSWSRTRGGSRSRSRSPRHGSGFRSRYRRSPVSRLSLSRSRSHSLERKKEPLSGTETPTQDSNHGESDLRLNTTSQSILSVVAQTTKRRCRDFDEKGYCMRGDLCPYDHGNDPVVLEDVALARVLPPFESGSSQGPVVTSAQSDMSGLSSGMSVATGFPAVMAGTQGPPPMLPISGHMPPFHHPRFSQPPPPVPAMEYNPDAPSMEPRMTWSRLPARGGAGIRGRMIRGPAPPPIPYNPMQQRDLISVPLNDQSANSGEGLRGINTNSGMGYKRGLPQDNNQSYPRHGETLSLDGPMNKRRPGFDFGRLGPRAKQNQGNCSLELKKVPHGVNNITHLNNHFAKFGKIVNIQVNFGGDSEAALVTFSSHAEANAAYRSTEAVLNNRFIKVFWHNNNNNNNSNTNEGKQENVPPQKPSVKDRLGAPNSQPTPMQVKVLNTNVASQQKDEVEEQVLMSGNTLTKTLFIKKEVTGSTPAPVIASFVPHHVNKAQAMAVATMKKMQEMAAAKQCLRKKQEEKRKEALRLTADLRKRKQDLLQKQLEQQKKLIERLENKEISKEQRQQLLNTIKSLQQSVENIRKDLASFVANSSAGSSKAAAAKILKRSTSLTKTSPALVKKTKEETQKEILDAELDLIAKQQEGGDTAELKKKLAVLKMEAANQATLQSSLKPQLGSFLTGRGRGLARSIALRNPTLYRTGIRRGSFSGHSVDHRPSKILVSGYEEDDKLEVLAHFAQFGEIVNHESDDSIPSLILNYKSRKEAELAMTKGRSFGDRLLSITWHGGLAGSRTGRTPHSLLSGARQRQVLMVGDSLDDLEDTEVVDEDDEELVGLGLEATEESLLLDDEDDDEDGEDRSWRR